MPLPYSVEEKVLEFYGVAWDHVARGRFDEALDWHAKAGEFLRAERERLELKKATGR